MNGVQVGQASPDSWECCELHGEVMEPICTHTQTDGMSEKLRDGVVGRTPATVSTSYFCGTLDS